MLPQFKSYNDAEAQTSIYFGLCYSNYAQMEDVQAYVSDLQFLRQVMKLLEMNNTNTTRVVSQAWEHAEGSVARLNVKIQHRKFFLVCMQTHSHARLCFSWMITPPSLLH